MSNERERFCPTCGRANPVNQPRCINCGQRVGGSVLLTGPEENTVRGPWWQVSENATIPAPPQVREEAARQEAARAERDRLIDEKRQLEARLAEERKRAKERARTGRNEQNAHATRQAQTEAVPVTVSKAAHTNCHRCGSPLGTAGHTFSFCLHCGTDLTGKEAKATKAAPQTQTIAPGVATARVNMHGINTQSVNPQTINPQITTQTVEADTNTIAPGMSAFLSFFVPGIGQFMNGQGSKGVLLLLALFVFSFVIKTGVGGLLLLLVRILGAIDAYRIAQRKQRGERVREDEWDFGG